MNFYAFEEICERADCLQIAKEIGLNEKKPGRFDIPWRPGSDSGALAINKDGWFDHVQQEKGSVIELVARVQFGGDIQKAQEWLGEHLGLEAKTQTRKRSKMVKVYAYQDPETGTDVHYTLRYEPKLFRQARPDPDPWGEEYIFDLDGVETILYRMSDWLTKKFVCVVEGEKDADTLFDYGIPATTCSQGAKAWKPAYNQHFAGKGVIIICDNDEAGREHGDIVAHNLHGIASQIRIVTPSKLHKGDVTDWFEREGGTAEKLHELAKATPAWTPFIDPDDEGAKIAAAKLANQEPLQNYVESWEIDEKTGKEKPVFIPRPMNEILRDLDVRLLGAPYRIGSVMFDRDRDTQQIKYIRDANALFAWIAMKTGHNPSWRIRGDGMVTKGEFFEAVFSRCEIYESISSVLDYPPRKDVYYLQSELPPPSKGHVRLHDLLDLLGPETLEDRALFPVFFAAAMFYRRGVSRPAWCIDSRDGQGSGKTTIPEILATLYGGQTAAGEVIMVPYRSLSRGMDEIVKRLVSATGRQKRILLLDNIQGAFDSPELAEMITSRSINGRAPYGRGEESRPNNLTFVMTMNTATLGRDMAERSMFIHLRKRQYDPNWKSRVYGMLADYGLHIIADIRDILTSEPAYSLPTMTRFPEFEKEVMQKAIPDPDMYSAVMKLQAERRGESDSDRTDASVVQSVFAEEISNAGFNPTTDQVFIRTEAVKVWLRTIYPDWGQNRISQTVRNFAKNKLIPEIQDKPRIYPSHGRDRRNGFMWRGEKHEDSAAIPTRIIGVNINGEAKIL